jgi:formamidopyrimidine-DNA glycosylase
VRVRSPFVVRTIEPPVDALVGQTSVGIERLGKRVVIAFKPDRYLVIHLMIAGRLRWFDGEPKGVGKIGLAEFSFDTGTLVLTEASTQKRASLHILQGRNALAALDAGGLEVMSCTPAEFTARLRSENHTLKRSLTDPRLFSGIGNAYSDEILHAARMSPVTLTSRVTDEPAAALHAAVVTTLTHWREKLRAEFGLDRGPGTFPGPGEITAFRTDFAVHGKFGQPCPRCGDPVRRIVYAANQCNYCATCQTGGKVLADRSLSRLLKEDWQKEME